VIHRLAPGPPPIQSYRSRTDSNHGLPLSLHWASQCELAAYRYPCFRRDGPDPAWPRHLRRGRHHPSAQPTRHAASDALPWRLGCSRLRSIRPQTPKPLPLNPAANTTSPFVLPRLSDRLIVTSDGAMRLASSLTGSSSWLLSDAEWECHSPTYFLPNSAWLCYCSGIMSANCSGIMSVWSRGLYPRTPEVYQAWGIALVVLEGASGGRGSPKAPPDGQPSPLPPVIPRHVALQRCALSFRRTALRVHSALPSPQGDSATPRALVDPDFLPGQAAGPLQVSAPRVGGNWATIGLRPGAFPFGRPLVFALPPAGYRYGLCRG